MEVSLKFSVSADAKENATSVKVLSAITGVLNGGETEAPAKPFAKAVADTEKAKTAPEALKEEVQKVAPSTEKAKPAPATEKAKPAPATEKPETEAPAKVTPESLVKQIMDIATRHNKKGRSNEIKAIKRLFVDESVKFMEVTDTDVLSKALEAYKLFDDKKDLQAVLDKYQAVDDSF